MPAGFLAGLTLHPHPSPYLWSLDILCLHAPSPQLNKTSWLKLSAYSTEVNLGTVFGEGDITYFLQTVI